MTRADQHRAIRTATALSESPHVACLRVTGEDAFATMERVCPAALTLQDAQLRPTVLLREDAVVFADAYVARDDEALLLLAEGPTAAELEAWVRGHATGPRLELHRFDETHRMLSVHGPWAWELLATCLGPDVVGMPYLSLLREERALCFRAGKTGEYGYDLLVPTKEVAGLRADLETHGRGFELAHVDAEALDQCALENWFFNIRREGKLGLTPLELGLLWRVTSRKDFVGAAALTRRRAQGAKSRLTCLMAEGEVLADTPVRFDDAVVGQVVSAGFCELRGQFIAAALLDLPLAWSGISGFEIAGVKARTVSPPVLDNRSLYVSPQRHTWRERDAVSFPTLAR